MSTTPSTLIVIGTFNHRLLDRIHRAEPSARILIRTDHDSAVLQSAVDTCDLCLVDDRVLDELSTAGIRGNLHPLSTHHPTIGSELERLDHRSSAESSRPILFCPSNDTHSLMFLAISSHLSNYEFLHFNHHDPQERTQETLREKGVGFQKGGPEMIAKIRPSVLVVANDWNVDSITLVDAAWACRIPTVCVQEGALDVGTDMHRMERCHFALLQGPVMFSLLPHEYTFLTGNPRFDGLEPSPLPQQPNVMINCNFTYGIHEADRDAWIRDTVESCMRLGADYFITQHPRDQGNFPDFNVRLSGVDAVHDQLRDCSILVTRFSTLVYEAMLMGRPCIYYNPHGEQMRIQAGPPKDGLLRASNPDSLCRLLEENMAGISPDLQERVDAILRNHCGAADGNAARRCASALIKVASHGSPLPFIPSRRPLAIHTQRIHHRFPGPVRRLYQKIRRLDRYPF
jgi:hypothetical protein